jgi:GntR family transcriptional repressor for pyruvate dehydrogenase complex
LSLSGALSDSGLHEVTGATLHQPRVAELVADAIRQRILDGELTDGAMLPNQEVLIAEFGVSRPSLREAMRILEAEGLITVIRGNVGGAVVHRPESRHAAYTLALVLQARAVPIDDVGSALKQLEGSCAGLCAARPDRAREVVPALEECNARAAAAIEDELAYVQATADFHATLVASCGSQTLQLIVGAVETLWLSHVKGWAESTTRDGTFPDRQYRLDGLAIHEEITALIAAGRVGEVVRLAEQHVDPTQFHSGRHDGGHRVLASTMRSPGRTAAPVTPSGHQ